MKNIIFLLFTFNCCFGQTVTNCSDDEQLIAYQDSLKAYNDWITEVKQHRVIIYTSKTIPEYWQILKKLGYVHEMEKNTDYSKDSTQAVEPDNDRYYLVSSMHTEDYSWHHKVYSLIIEAPKHKVVYQPYKEILKPIVSNDKQDKVTNVTYHTLKLDGTRTLDSAKIFVQEVR